MKKKMRLLLVAFQILSITIEPLTVYLCLNCALNVFMFLLLSRELCTHVCKCPLSPHTHPKSQSLVLQSAYTLTGSIQEKKAHRFIFEASLLLISIYTQIQLFSTV